MEESQVTDPLSSPGQDTSPVNMMLVVRQLCSAANSLFARVELYGQLLRVEWAEEKNRLVKILLFALAGFACLLCGMLFTGILVLVFFRETTYLYAAVAALIVVYGVGAGIAWQRIHALSRLSNRAFAATCEEIAADIALIRAKL